MELKNEIRVFLLLLWAVTLVACAGKQTGTYSNKPFEKLSDYHFFQGEMRELVPFDRVVAYDLISPLFSDYAEKARFVWLPEGTSASYSENEVFDFPVGAVLIKNFFYDGQSNYPGDRRIIETRLLVNRSNGWEALPYIWNEEQTEAYLEVAGGSTTVSLAMDDGTASEFEYLIPNKNQCKGCHEVAGKVSLIGPKARNLAKGNQLQNWLDKGLLASIPAGGLPPALVDYRDQSADLDQRALAYLEMNCGHCHRPEGPGNTSGLHLTTLEKERSNLGFCKSPVAAGKGSGGRLFDIVPGDPDASILLYRMESNDPGIKMPELGRKLVHKEGVDLIRQWIADMEPEQCGS